MSTQRYYDAFSEDYDAHRAEPYHALLDQLEIATVRRHLAGATVLDVACGTGLLELAFREQAARVVGLDLSRGMLRRARERGHTVLQGSAYHLPFPDAQFDLVTCFKAFPHMDRPAEALQEFARVLRPGGHLALEVYNPASLRALLRRHGPKRSVSRHLHEGHVLTRFDPPLRVARTAPPTLTLRALHPIRVLLPAAALLRVPVLGTALRHVERALFRVPAAYRVAGFVVLLFERVPA